MRSRIKVLLTALVLQASLVLSLLSVGQLMGAGGGSASAECPDACYASCKVSHCVGQTYGCYATPCDVTSPQCVCFCGTAVFETSCGGTQQ